jgi:hypothetical protein
VAAEPSAAKEIGRALSHPRQTFNGPRRDKGIRGLVLKSNASMVAKSQNALRSGRAPGAALGDVARYAGSLHLTGLEFAVGIPGSIGGAVFMNAGAYDGEIGGCVAAVTAVSQEGRLRRFSHDDIRFGYRDSIFQHNGYIICEVELALREGNPAAIARKMNEYTRRREAKQPIEMPSAGSSVASQPARALRRPHPYRTGRPQGVKGRRRPGLGEACRLHRQRRRGPPPRRYWPSTRRVHKSAGPGKVRRIRLQPEVRIYSRTRN